MDWYAPRTSPCSVAAVRLETRDDSVGVVIPIPSAITAMAARRRGGVVPSRRRRKPAIRKTQPAITRRASPTRGARRRTRPPWTTTEQTPTKTKNQATVDGPAPSRSERNWANVDSKFANAVVVTKERSMSAPISGRRKAARSGPAEKSGPEGATFPAGRVSGSLKKAQTHATSERPAANSPGAASPRCTAKPPIAGPKMKPSPNAIPTIAIPRARSVGAVESAMTACAVPMFPPVAPGRRRATKSIGSERAKAKRT